MKDMISRKSLFEEGTSDVVFESSSSDAVERRIFFALIFGLAFAPFWLGSDRPITWGLNAVYYGVLVLIYEFSLLCMGRDHPIPLRHISFPAACYVMVIVWSLLQVAPFMPETLRHPIWSIASEALGEAIPGSISVTPDLTMLAVTRLSTYGLVFWLSLQLCHRDHRALALGRAIGVIGLAYAIYGILAFFGWPGTILWYEKEHYRDSLTSTFVNRNSYATYAGIGLVCALSCGLRAFESSALPSSSYAGRKAAAMVATTIGPGGGWISCALLIGVGLMFTGSRGGIVSTLAGVMLFVTLAAVRGRERPIALAWGMFLTISVIWLILFGFGDFLAERLRAQSAPDGGRSAVYALTLRMIADAPLFGTGYGAFQDVFKMYRDASVPPPWFWDRAHDTYLELMQGLGIPVAAMFVVSVATLVARCVYGAIGRQGSATIPLAAAASSFIVGLHAFVDFSLQVQAVALTWVVVLGAGVAQSLGALPKAMTRRNAQNW